MSCGSNGFTGARRGKQVVVIDTGFPAAVRLVVAATTFAVLLIVHTATDEIVRRTRADS